MKSSMSGFVMGRRNAWACAYVRERMHGRVHIPERVWWQIDYVYACTVYVLDITVCARLDL